MALNHRRPPSVVYPVERSRTLAMGLATLWLAGGAVLGGWAVLGMGSGAMGGLAACAWMLALAGVLRFWRGQPRGAVRWDGQSWAFQCTPKGLSPGTSVAMAASPDVLLDLQSHLWVKIRFQDGPPAWIWLERKAQPERWMDLRRAVYSRARPGADNADETAPANSRGA